MTVDSTAVRGRRRLRFASFEEMLADAQRLSSSSGTRTLGNWPPAQLITHLAATINASIDGIRDIKVKPPLLMRLFGPLLKRRVFKRGLPSGFRLPKDVETIAYPSATSPQAALEMLQAAVERTRQETMTARHPVFGDLTHEEWTVFHLQHAAMHLSFAVPATE